MSSNYVLREYLKEYDHRFSNIDSGFYDVAETVLCLERGIYSLLYYSRLYMNIIEVVK